MVKFTDFEIKKIKIEIENILKTYNTDEEIRDVWNELHENIDEIMRDCIILLNNLDKVNTDKKINDLVEHIYYEMEFHIYLVRFWDAATLEYICDDMPKYKVRLYRKFYKKKYFE